LDVEERPAAPTDGEESKPAADERSPARAAVLVRPAGAESGKLGAPLALNDSDVPLEAGVPEDGRQYGSAPVRITIGPQGLILSSPDTRALDQMEDLLANLSPARSSFSIFSLEHTYAKDVASLLKDIFKEDDGSGKSKSTEFLETLYFGFSPNQSTTKPRSSLSKRKPLSFVPDPVTNTILVQNADEAQLAEIERLIDIYDRVEPPDAKSVRRTQMIPLKYAVAKQVSEVIKDVYRDLLSPIDKALQQANAQKQQQQQEQRPMPFYSYFQPSGESNEEKQLPRFKGLLSVGVDELTNTLVVSAPQGLLADVAAMAESLDRSAQPLRPVVNVMKLQNFGTAMYLRGSPGNGRRLTPPREPANGNSPGAAQPKNVAAQPDRD
jgi:type II secretory pathway component GspD/PulD (secretin)